MKKITIIIPVYNKEEYFSRCFDSIISQIDIDKHQFEILVVDDGSKDNSHLIIEEYVNNHPSLFTYLRQENSGVSVARNNALRKASGEFVIFLDADDELLDGTLPKVFDYLNANNDIDMLVTVQTRNNGVTEKIASVHGLVEGVIYTGVEAYKAGYVRLNAGGGICRTDFLRKHNILFPVGVRNSEDTIFFGVVQTYAMKIAYLNLPFYRIHEIQGSASRLDNSKIAIRHADSVRAAAVVRKGLNCSCQQKGIFEFHYFQIISNMISRYSSSKELCYSQLCNSIEIKKLLPIDTRYMCIRRFQANLLNFNFTLYYFISFIKHKLF